MRGKKKKKKNIIKRTEQDSNLRGQSPLDFESNALTTRPSVQIVWGGECLYIYSYACVYPAGQR